MRRLLFFLAVFAFSPVVFSQTFLWEEFSSNQMPPPGWTIDNYQVQWSSRYTNNAGGNPPEANFTYINQTGISRLISPVIDLTGYDSVTFSFRHKYHDSPGTGPGIGVATRSAGGNWKTVWQLNPVTTISPTMVKVPIKNSDVGSSSFQVCIYVSGNFFNFWDWWVDDILLSNSLDLDEGITLVTTPQYLGGPAAVTGQLRNFGNTTITGTTIDWRIDNGPVHSTDFSGLAVNTLETFDFTCTDLVNTTFGDHELVVWIDKVNGIKDMYSGDDTLAMQVRRVSHTEPYRPLFEEFTSSTCIPCAFFNTDFEPWCNDHDSDITLLKYQMNWPLPGDPYYTPEGGSRKNFYNVISIPDLYVGGNQYPTDIVAVAGAFATSQKKQGLAKIAASFNVSVPNLTVKATMLPFDGLEHVVVRAIVFEEVTTGNVRNNGETSFKHVMMKMVPDSNGIHASLSDRVPFTIDRTVNLTGTHVEQYSDLGVVIFIQDSLTKQVCQSGYATRDKVFNDEARLASVSTGGVPVAGFDPDLFSYTETLPGGTTSVPGINAVPMDPRATVIITPALTLPGTTTIDVFAENLIRHDLYTVSFDFPAGTGEKPQLQKAPWPNPSKGIVHVGNAAGAEVSVYDATGGLVKKIGSLSGTVIDLRFLERGVYILVITRPGLLPVREKMVLL